MISLSTRLAMYLLLLAGGTLFAEDRSFEERLFNPDLTRQPNLGRMKFEGEGTTLSREFEGRKSFATTTLESKRHEPRRFLGIPIPWFGEKKIKTKNYAAADREFVTKVAENFQRDNSPLGDKDFGDGKKNAFSSARDIPLSEAIVVGKSQKFLDSQSQDLSIDEVRELLNKDVD